MLSQTVKVPVLIMSSTTTSDRLALLSYATFNYHITSFCFLKEYIHLKIPLTSWQYLVSPSPNVAELFTLSSSLLAGCQWIVLNSCHIHDLFSRVFYSRRVRRILWTVRSTWPTTWCSIYCVWRRSTQSTCWRNPSTSSSTIEPCLVLWSVRTVMIESFS